jgi:small-conductance mechanosensitive channel
MKDWIEIVGPNHEVAICGVKLVGINAQTGDKLLFSLVFVIALLAANRVFTAGCKLVIRGRANEKVRFWIRQASHLATAFILIIGLVSIWFDDPTRLATALGLVTAGLTFALQKVITALAGYFVILRGRTFNVGDRIRMGGVRGDVIDLGFIQTTIMEMGEPPAVQADDPAMWVRSRQYTGRVVTVSNARIFDDPVYNYTRQFPFIWEEMHLPVPYNADRHRAEKILLDAARKHTIPASELRPC